MPAPQQQGEARQPLPSLLAPRGHEQGTQTFTTETRAPGPAVRNARGKQRLTDEDCARLCYHARALSLKTKGNGPMRGSILTLMDE